MSPLFEITSITTYPVKGFAGQSHQSIMACKGAVLPGDRAYALSSGTKASQMADKHSWMKKAHFLQAMALSELAELSLTFDDASKQLCLSHQGNIIFDGHLDDPAAEHRLCNVMASYLDWPDDLPQPRLFHYQTGGLTDTKTAYVAFGNQASMTDFGAKAGINDDERRYRLNVMMTGGDAFSETALIGKKARIGSAEFHFIEPVGRCAAIEVDPQSAKRQKGLVSQLQRYYDHTDMGIFATVTKTGTFDVGDKLTIMDDEC
ncbi:MAG: MOSC domain-containing protein [Candidatus Puniceispirillaceae bacterium]